MTIRTRFAPSPTGYLHIGGARTALFSWLYARRHGGTFILRIEDTDLERSTAESVNAILEGMTWLGLEYDEGPFYQTERFDRYKEVIQQLLDGGHAYHCYCTREELDEMRAGQMERKEKPRYDGRCRHRAEPRAGVPPVVRFKNPDEGAVVIDDIVRDRVVFQNRELDDLIIARSDGSPTYNLTVVVDDLDMGITHVIRGEDHLNNTPRQINILQALGAHLPRYAHLSMIHGADGAKLSKRHGAVSVMQYRDDGYLPEALVNYLARLGWSHGDEELFSREQLISWFDLEHISKSPARFDPEKLKWLNAQYQKAADVKQVEPIAKSQFERSGIDLSNGPPLSRVVSLMKDRTATAAELSQTSSYFYSAIVPLIPLRNQYYTSAIKPALVNLKERFSKLSKTEWTRERINEELKAVVAQHKLKLPQIAMPLRVIISGGTETPSIDATLAVFDRDEVLARMERELQAFPE